MLREISKLINWAEQAFHEGLNCNRCIGRTRCSCSSKCISADNIGSDSTRFCTVKLPVLVFAEQAHARTVVVVESLFFDHWL